VGILTQHQRSRGSTKVSRSKLAVFAASLQFFGSAITSNASITVAIRSPGQDIKTVFTTPPNKILAKQYAER